MGGGITVFTLPLLFIFYFNRRGVWENQWTLLLYTIVQYYRTLYVRTLLVLTAEDFLKHAQHGRQMDHHHKFTSTQTLRKRNSELNT